MTKNGHISKASIEGSIILHENKFVTKNHPVKIMTFSSILFISNIGHISSICLKFSSHFLYFLFVPDFRHISKQRACHMLLVFFFLSFFSWARPVLYEVVFLWVCCSGSTQRLNRKEVLGEARDRSCDPWFTRRVT